MSSGGFFGETEVGMSVVVWAGVGCCGASVWWKVVLMGGVEGSGGLKTDEALVLAPPVGEGRLWY